MLAVCLCSQGKINSFIKGSSKGSLLCNSIPLCAFCNIPFALCLNSIFLSGFQLIDAFCTCHFFLCGIVCDCDLCFRNHLTSLTVYCAESHLTGIRFCCKHKLVGVLSQSLCTVIIDGCILHRRVIQLQRGSYLLLLGSL